MGRRAFGAVAWGLAGLVVGLVLTLGAFAIAGQEISEPASVPVLTPGATTSAPDATPSQGNGGKQSVATSTETTSPSDDDNSGPGSGDGEDSSGDGSDHSGSGSENSGSGSDSDDSSGSGSGEHEDD